MSVTRAVDPKGRLTLGKALAGRLVTVQQVGEGVWQVMLVDTVPARETWLYRNPKAFAAVTRGLQQAAAGELVEGPDLDASLAFTEEIEE